MKGVHSAAIRGPLGRCYSSTINVSVVSVVVVVVSVTCCLNVNPQVRR